MHGRITMYKIILIFISLVSGCSVPILKESDKFIYGDVIELPVYVKSWLKDGSLNYLDPEKPKRQLDYNELGYILHKVHNKFYNHKNIWQTKKKQYDWPKSFDSLNKDEIIGDCKIFAQLLRKELYDIGYKSRLALVGTEDKKRVDHAVVIYENWTMDLNSWWPMRKSDFSCYD